MLLLYEDVSVMVINMSPINNILRAKTEKKSLKITDLYHNYICLNTSTKSKTLFLYLNVIVFSGDPYLVSYRM